jgi:ABC-type transport system involved in multi-copper enzyme maturation permease subunit
VRAILAIAGNTLKEGLRNRLLYILLGIALLIIFSSRGCMSSCSASFQGNQLSDYEVARNVTTVVFHIIMFWSLTVAGLLSMGAVLGDIESGVITVFISKPISRFEYLFGKFVGVSLISIINIALLGLGLFFVSYSKTLICQYDIFLACAVFTLNIFLLISFIFLISLISTRIIAMAIGIIFYLMSVGLDIPLYFDSIRYGLTGSEASLLTLKILYFALPQWGATQFYATSFIYDVFSSSMSFWPIPHTLIYTVFIWLLMVLLFGRKEF